MEKVDLKSLPDDSEKINRRVEIFLKTTKIIYHTYNHIYNN